MINPAPDNPDWAKSQNKFIREQAIRKSTPSNCYCCGIIAERPAIVIVGIDAPGKGARSALPDLTPVFLCEECIRLLVHKPNLFWDRFEDMEIRKIKQSQPGRRPDPKEQSIDEGGDVL